MNLLNDMDRNLFRYKKQPKNSWLCGETCIAMLSGKSLDEICSMIGKKKEKGTKTKTLVTILRRLGYDVPNRLICCSTQPLFAIAKQPLHGKNGNWHWVLIWNGKKYDPSGKHPHYDMPLSSYLLIRNID